MAKLKLTKNEQKKQKDSLKMFKRYLPTLMLKKQQLQMEIRGIDIRANELCIAKEKLNKSFDRWIAIFADEGVFTEDILKITSLVTKEGNIAGVSIPIFENVEFEVAEYDLIEKPLWLDLAVEDMEKALRLDLELQVLEEQQRCLKKELQTTSQRVNLLRKSRYPKPRQTLKRLRFIWVIRILRR
jgi:V/A-type H+-transporting ATPase subunit D